MSWNYRIVEYADGSGFGLHEVYYGWHLAHGGTQHAANCAQTDWMARQKKRPMYPVTRDPMPPCTCGLDALRKEANRG